MTELFFASGSAPFTIALVVMFGLFLFEIISLFSGLGVNEVIDDLVVGNVDMPDIGDIGDIGDIADMPSVDGYSAGEVPGGIEGSSTPEGGSLLGRMLAWLYVGRVPVLIVLVLFLGIFGVIGLMGQSILRNLTGMALPAVIAAPAVFMASLPPVRWSAAGLARILPKDETSAVSTDSFIGRTATVMGGTARPDLPGQARLRDQFGTTHYVMVVPEQDDGILENGSLILLVRQVNGHFSAIPNPNAALTDSE